MFWMVLGNTMMASKYMIHHCKCKLPRQLCISLWDVADALVKPNGILSHSYQPNGPIVNAVNGFVHLDLPISSLRSSDVNQSIPLRQSYVSWILGKPQASLTVMAFNFLRSM